MELFTKIVFSIIILLVVCLFAGFIDACWEQHQREKANRHKNEKRGD